MSKRLFKTQFEFQIKSYGHYVVIYTTASGRLRYRAHIHYMPLIDAVKHEDFPTQRAMSDLAHSVRYHGVKVKVF